MKTEELTPNTIRLLYESQQLLLIDTKAAEKIKEVASYIFDALPLFDKKEEWRAYLQWIEENTGIVEFTYKLSSDFYDEEYTIDRKYYENFTQGFADECPSPTDFYDYVDFDYSEWQATEHVSVNKSVMELIPFWKKKRTDRMLDAFKKEIFKNNRDSSLYRFENKEDYRVIIGVLHHSLMTPVDIDFHPRSLHSFRLDRVNIHNQYSSLTFKYIGA